jgi:predicted SAM-dependent methyltransferase
MAEKVLNLGAANRIIKGAVNHDLRKHRKEISIAYDLNSLPWPWDDRSFDKIHAIDVLEHLEINLIQSLDQCWRILKVGGELIFKFPLHTSPTIREDPTHRWFWGPGVLDFVDPSTSWGRKYRFYTDNHWRVVSKKFLRDDKRSLQAILTPRK